MGVVGPFFGCMVMDETWFWVGGSGEGWVVAGKILFGGFEWVVHFFGCMGLAGAYFFWCGWDTFLGGLAWVETNGKAFGVFEAVLGVVKVSGDEWAIW